MSDVSVEKEAIQSTQILPQQEVGSPAVVPHGTCDESLSDVESQVVTTLTAVMTQQRNNNKSHYPYQAPLPMERGNAYALPAWLVISIAVLSVIGVVGGVMELIVQYRFV